MRFLNVQRWLLVTLTISLCPADVLADDPAKNSNTVVWDRFRGPNGTGTTDDKDIPLTFGADENMIWKVALPGAGNSSPIVWGKHLFLQSASNDGKLRSLHCLDTANGKIRWQRSIPAGPAKIRADSSLASSTPTTDGKAVYVSFWDGTDVLVSAYDFHGDALWSRNLGSFNSQHGPGASPILYKDKLILANDMDKDDFNTKVPNALPSMLVALDKQTGRPVWETARAAERACYSAPFLRPRPGQREPELIVTSSTAVTGYDVETGAKLWEAKGWQEHAVKVPMRTVASPTLAGDILCVCSGGDAGRFAIGLALPRPGHTGAPQRIWQNRKDFPYVSSPVSRGEHVYFVNDAGFAGCYHARTGKRLWFERLADTGFHASPLLIDGKIYATSTAGGVYVFAAEPTFRLLAHSDLGEGVRATAAVADGRLYIRGERHLFCIGKRRVLEPIPESRAGEKNDGWIKLFNGKNLDGWKMFLDPSSKVSPKEIWKVDDGVIVCDGSVYGYLLTDKEYDNYVLKVQWRWGEKVSQGRNSGVFVHVSGPDKIWPKGVEAQLEAGHAGDFWLVDHFKLTIDPQRRDPQIARHYYRLKDHVEKKVGAWNQYEITCRGDSIKLVINGQTVNEGTEAEMIKGRILLQSEGAEIHFRNVELKHLEPANGKPKVVVVSERDVAEKLDGKAIKATTVEVTLEPGQAGMPHRHPGPVFGYILEGEYEWAIDAEPAKKLKRGDTFYEPAMCLHRVSRNPSAKSKARILAVMLVPRDAKVISIPEPAKK